MDRMTSLASFCYLIIKLAGLVAPTKSLINNRVVANYISQPFIDEKGFGID